MSLFFVGWDIYFEGWGSASTAVPTDPPVEPIVVGGGGRQVLGRFKDPYAHADDTEVIEMATIAAHAIRTLP